MNAGYCIEGGTAYYCSEPCLYTVFTPEEWAAIADEDGDSYWTELEPESEETEEPTLMKALVYYANGDHIITSINGTEKSIKEYYAVGKVFNIGSGENDNLQAVVSCDVWDAEGSMGDFDELGNPNTFTPFNDGKIDADFRAGLFSYSTLGYTLEEDLHNRVWVLAIFSTSIAELEGCEEGIIAEYTYMGESEAQDDIEKLEELTKCHFDKQ